MIAVLEALFIDRAFVEPSFKSWTNALTALVQLGLLMFIHTLLYHCGPHAGDPIDEPMPTNLKHDEWHADEQERKKKGAAFWNKRTPRTYGLPVCVLYCHRPDYTLNCGNAIQATTF